MYITPLKTLKLTQPFKADGSDSNYVKMMQAAKMLGNEFTREEILKVAFPEKWKNGSFVGSERDGCPAKIERYYSTYFSILNKNHIITYNKQTKKLEQGKLLNRYISKYSINPEI